MSVADLEKYHMTKYKKDGPNHSWKCSRCSYYLLIRQGEVIEENPGRLGTQHVPVGPGPGNILEGDEWLTKN
jgi:hypothetical protein